MTQLARPNRSHTELQHVSNLPSSTICIPEVGSISSASVVSEVFGKNLKEMCLHKHYSNHIKCTTPTNFPYPVLLLRIQNKLLLFYDSEDHGIKGLPAQAIVITVMQPNMMTLQFRSCQVQIRKSSDFTWYIMTTDVFNGETNY